MMNIEIRRKWETARSVCGEMWIDGKLFCYTLEPSRSTPVHAGHPCIPAGSYKVILTESPHLGYVTPEVLDVPGRTAIRWHVGNGPEDVLGCIAVGSEHTTDFVAHSRDAFNRLMVALHSPDAKDGITAHYFDPEPFYPDIYGEIAT
jgi:hypothetical protein